MPYVSTDITAAPTLGPRNCHVHASRSMDRKHPHTLSGNGNKAPVTRLGIQAPFLRARAWPARASGTPANSEREQTRVFSRHILLFLAVTPLSGRFSPGSTPRTRGTGSPVSDAAAGSARPAVRLPALRPHQQPPPHTPRRPAGLGGTSGRRVPLEPQRQGLLFQGPVRPALLFRKPDKEAADGSITDAPSPRAFTGSRRAAPHRHRGTGSPAAAGQAGSSPAAAAGARAAVTAPRPVCAAPSPHPDWRRRPALPCPPRAAPRLPQQPRSCVNRPARTHGQRGREGGRRPCRAAPQPPLTMSPPSRASGAVWFRRRGEEGARLRGSQRRLPPVPAAPQPPAGGGGRGRGSRGAALRREWS